MSGGSYNYLCFSEARDLLNKRSDLHDMVEALSNAGAIDAAQETESIILILNHFEARMEARIKRLKNVWQGIEWWHSGDRSKEQFEKDLAEYRKDIEPHVG